ncbi:gliding motility-associated C-terminal domain-containing protein [Ohtaekwangia koreensis]|uniref:Gliding motility-associated C-terminal domain-containing protein/Por secretion system C-terminal sorting domain-containing protein n=1 Tax=Ohtaekwangia koreensis TaxID=688867 RepID=A0A1T5JWI6_9BACT|nr:gliding motility-associated C-terminal domain-containing protein [Ohtaekwangia koreensis]SKC55761.1 gliding motility-associated C-terminal domain-containing protein/Por secretion system C-terminal sorting domain-containing protein [Ohtaekwangia koreensis]
MLKTLYKYFFALAFPLLFLSHSAIGQCLTINVSSQDVNCNGGNDGQISVTTNTGVAPFRYDLYYDDGGLTLLGSVTTPSTSVTFQTGNGTLTEPGAEMFGIPANAGVSQYRVVVQASGGGTIICERKTTFVTIDEPANPLLITVNSINPDCNPSVGIGEGDVNITASGGTSPYTFLWSDGATSEDRTDIDAGTYSVTATDANGCETTISVTIPVVTQANAGADQTVCADNTTLAGNAAGTGEIGTWTVVSGTGTFGNANSPTTTVGSLSFGANVFRWTITDSGLTCTGTTSTVTITRSTPASVDAGAPQTICNGGSATLAGVIGGSATSATWSGGTGTFAPNNATLNAVYTPSAAEITAGTVTLTLTTNDPLGPCPAVSDNVVITINATATVDAGPAQTICAGSTVTLAGTFGGSATGVSWSTSGDGTFNNITNPSAIYTPGVNDRATGSVTLTLSTDDPAGPCLPATDNVIITISPVATVDAGPAQTVCGSSTVTLAGTIGGSATSATWSGGTGTFSPNNTTLTAVYTPSAAEITAGSVTLTLTTNDPAGPCPAATDNVVITLDPIATVDAGAAQTICAGSTVTLTGTIGGAAISATWSGGTGTFAPNANTLNAVYTPSAAEITAGSVTLTLTTNDPAGLCPAATDNVVITISPAAIVDAGPAQTVCGSSTITLAGTIGGSATSATWSGGTGTFAPNNTTLNAVYTPSAAEITAGTVTLTLTTNDPAGTCTAATDNVTITLDPVATVDAGAAQTICAGGTVTLAGTIGGGATSATWSGGTGTFSPNSSTLTAVYTPSAAEVLAGTVTLTLTTNDPAGLCPAATDNVTITISPAATVDAGPAQTICGSGTVTLAGTIGGSATSATWSGGTGTFAPNNTTLNAVYTPSAAEITAGTVTLTLTTNDPAGACTAATDNVTITINQPATVDAGAAQTICAGSTVTLAGTIGGSATSATWSGGTGAFSPNNSTLTAVYTPSAAEVLAGTVTLTLTTNDPAGLCPAATDNVTITISPAATVDAGPAQTICGSGTVTLAGTIGGSATSATWSGGTGTFAPNNTTLNAVYTPSAAEITAGTVTLTLTTNDPAGTCTAATDNVTITINQPATVDAGAAQTICAGSTVTLAGTIGGSATSATWSGGTGTFSPNNSTLTAIYTPSAAEITAGTVTLTLTTNDPAGTCPSVNDNVVITITPAATVNAGPDQSICAGSTITLAGTVGGSATGGTWSGGTGTFAPNNTTLGAVYTPSAAEVTAGTVTLTLTTSGPCAVVTDNVTITISPAATVNAGPDQSICAGSTVTLAGTIGGSATGGTWSGGTGTFAPNNTTLGAVYTPSAAEVTAGTVTLTLTTSGPCAVLTDNVTITINPAATVSAGPDQTICAGGTVTLAGTIGGSATGATWSGGTGTFAPNNTTLGAVYTPSAAEVTAGTVTLTLTTTGPCATVTDNVTITISPAATANAGADQTICAGSTVTLAGSVSGAATGGIWSGGTGTFAPNNTTLGAVYTPSAAEVLAGTVTLTLTTTGPCTAGTDNIVITIGPVATVDAGPAQTICAGGTVTLAGTIGGSATSATWSGGTGTFAPNNTTLTAVYTPSAAEITAGTVTLTLTTNDPAGPCAAVTDNVTITISPAATVNAGPDQAICAGNTVTLAGTVGGSATGGTWSGGTGTFAPNATTLNAVYTPSAAEVTAGTVTLTLTTNGPCSTLTDNVTITISPAATVSAGPDQTICAGSTITLSGAVGGGATGGTWSGGTGTFAPNNTTLTAVYTPSAAEVTAGTVTLTLTTSGPCAAATDDVVITISPAPTVDAGAAQTICAGSTVTLAGTIGGAATSATWTGGAGTFAPNNTTLNAIYTPTAAEITAGTVTLTLTTNDPTGSCTAVSDNVTITIDDAATANAGTDQDICAGGTVTLAGTVGGSASSGTWSGGTGTFAPNNTTLTAVYTPSATEIAAGTVTLTLTTNDPAGSCVAGTDDVVITINQAPTAANAGPDQTVCGPATLAANTPTEGTGQWTIVSGTGGSLGDASNPGTTFSGTGGSTYILRWTITNGSCTASTDDVSITFDINTPTTANAGADQAVCTTSTTLAANTPVTGTGAWSIISGTGGVLTDAANPTTAFTGTGGSTYILRWSISTGGTCTPSTDDVTIAFEVAPTTANAGTDQSVCATTATLAANVAIIGTGTWTIISGTGGSFADDNDPATVFTGTAGQTYVLQWTITNSCGPSSDQVTIELESAPTTANAGTDQTICGPATLAANTPTIGTGQWTIVSGTGGSLVDDTDPATTFTGTAGSTYILRWTITNGSCTPSTDDVSITFDINTPTTANAGPDQGVCGTSTVLAANTAAIGTGQWTIVSGAGGSFDDDALPAATFTGTAGTTYILRWTITGSCATTFDDVEVEFEVAPTTASAGPDQTVCGPATLAANTPTVGTGQWTVVSGTGGTFADNTNPTTTFSGTGGSTYVLRWTISNGSCTPSTDEVSITFDINTPTTANAGSDQSICTTSTTLAANAPVTGTGGWSIISGTGGVLTDVANPTTAFTGTAGTTYILRWSISTGGTCTPSTDDVTIALEVAPTTSVAGVDQSICATTATLAANTAAIGTGTWTIISGTGGSFADDNDPATVFTGTAGQTYVLQWTIANSCSSSFDQVTIELEATPTVANAGADQTVCGPATLTGNTPVVGTGQWTVVSGTGGVFADDTNPTTTFSGTGGATYVIRWTISNGSCTPSSDDVSITFDINTPTTANAGPDQAVCLTSTTLAANTPVVGTGAWTVVSGTGGNFGDAASPVSTFTGTAGATYILRWTIDTGGTCTPSTDDVTISFDVTPTVANAGADQTVCATTATLAANVAAIGTGTWTVISGTGGSFADDNDPATIFTGTAGQTYVLQWTIANACATTSDQVTIKLDAAPTVANAGPDQGLCGVFTTTLAANTPTVGAGVWTIISGTGGVVITPTSPTSQFVGVAGNSYTLRWVITNGSCTPSIDDVVINFSASPVATSPVTVCVNNPAPVLTATAPGATSFRWYLFTAPSTRTLLATTPTGSFTPGAELIRTTPGTFTYEVTAVYTCGESPATQIVVNVSNTGGCSGGGTGNCATVRIVPHPHPATCTLSNGWVSFTIDPLVPAVNTVGVIIRIDGISSTNLTITRTNYNDTTMLNLPMGTYTYTITYGDASCVKPGTFTIDQSGTVGTPVASNIVQPVCAGSATGALTLDIVGETGNVLEWSLDGITWETFTAGSQITGIPAGAAPTFERVISVRRNSSDPCNAAVTVVMQDANPVINATFDITSSTCNGNDGEIKNIAATGGVGGPYTYSLDGTTFQAANEFLAIPGGAYTLTVKDNGGCEQTFAANVTFPGFIDFSAAVVTATCTNNGLSGKLVVKFTNPGTYQAGISADPLVEPTKYRTYTTFDPTNDVPLTFDSLGRGTYYIFAKGASALCATRQGPFTIDGVYAITFDIVPICNNNEVSISLTNITGEPGIPFEIQVFKKFTNIVLETYPVSSIPVTGSVLLEYADHPFLQLPDEYQIQINQVQSSTFCLLSSELTDYKVVPHLFAQVGVTSESYPDILTGKMQVGSFTGGQIPYQIRIELDSASVGGQAYQSDWEEVLVNNNLQYEKNYSNVPAGRYSVQVMDSIGCVIEIVGRVPLDTDIYIPNIFTPNEDGSNDVFFIRNLPDADAKLVITDRWGKQVYSTNSYQNNWEAEDVSDGIYFYRLKIGEGSAITGWVEVLRGAKP